MDTELSKFLAFQKDQDGVATPTDAAEYCLTGKSQLKRWVSRYRLKTLNHCGRTYYGMRSLRDHMFFRRQMIGYKKEILPATPAVPPPILEPSGARYYSWSNNRP